MDQYQADSSSMSGSGLNINSSFSSALSYNTACSLWLNTTGGNMVEPLPLKSEHPLENLL